MEYINLGPTGLKVSRLCLGAMTYGSKQWRPWILEEEEARPFIRQALELGINYFDTADIYSGGKSEELLGRALKDFGPGRDRLVIATSAGSHQAATSQPGQRLSRAIQATRSTDIPTVAVIRTMARTRPAAKTFARITSKSHCKSIQGRPADPRGPEHGRLVRAEPLEELIQGTLLGHPVAGHDCLSAPPVDHHHGHDEPDGE